MRLRGNAMKRTEIKRRTPLRADPEKVYAWIRKCREKIWRSNRGFKRRNRGRDWKTMRAGLAERSEGLCERPGCGRWIPYGIENENVHHVLLRSKGGKDELENLLAVCRDCHSWIHNNPKAAKAEGVLK